jgi:hypothetical protein
MLARFTITIDGEDLSPELQNQIDILEMELQALIDEFDLQTDTDIEMEID